MLPEEFFANRMRVLRNLQGISQKALAANVCARLGYTVDGTAVTRIEKGQRLIRLGEAVAIADALGVPLAELMPTDDTGGRQRIVELPDRVLEQLRVVHESTGAVIQLAEGSGS